MFFSDNASISDKASRYSREKYTLSLVETGYLLLLLVLFTTTGLSVHLERPLHALFRNNTLTLAVYILILYLGYYALTFPLNFYGSFLLEHKFSLTKQTAKDWFKDQAKSGLLFYLFALILVSAFYYILKHFLHSWWLVVSVFWIFFSLILARLTPVLIIPLFFKYKKLSDEQLRSRITSLAEKMKVRILDVFEIDFSKKTLKANAAFVGFGKTRRVILADTLKDKYSYDEIEVILAHEFAHYRLKHLFKLILINAGVTMGTFLIIFLTNEGLLRRMGFISLWDIASIPVLLMYLVVLGLFTRPFENFLSRRFEREADNEALNVTGLKAAFISTFEKLASQNLADRSPHPLIKFFFFDHPPIDERIALAKNHN